MTSHQFISAVWHIDSLLNPSALIHKIRRSRSILMAVVYNKMLSPWDTKHAFYVSLFLFFFLQWELGGIWRIFWATKGIRFMLSSIFLFYFRSRQIVLKVAKDCDDVRSFLCFPSVNSIAKASQIFGLSTMQYFVLLQLCNVFWRSFLNAFWVLAKNGSSFS